MYIPDATVAGLDVKQVERGRKRWRLEISELL